jgi:predicted MPP superfamily phosphohydrolase
VFLVVVLAGFAAANVYVGWRMVHAPKWPRAWRVGLTLLIVALSVSAPLGLMLWRTHGADEMRPLTLVGTTWAGALFLLSVVLGALDLLRAGAAVVRRVRRGPAPVDLDRRRLMARAVAGVAGVTAAGLTTIALRSAAEPPREVDVKVPLARLPGAFQGFRIVQLSDLHVGPLLRKPFLDHVVDRTLALEPDVVAITGDLVDASPSDLRDVVSPLARLRARHGVFFVTGNHEYYVGADAWFETLPSLGIRPLRNERVEIARGSDRLDLAGVEDASASHQGSGHGADYERALAGRPTDRPVVLLAHQPRQVFDAERYGVDLQLSGHTHGGQIAPFGLITRLVQPALAGLHRFGTDAAPTWLYVNRGTGFWGPPMRLANPAEITIVELTRA